MRLQVSNVARPGYEVSLRSDVIPTLLDRTNIRVEDCEIRRATRLWSMSLGYQVSLGQCHLFDLFIVIHFELVSTMSLEAVSPQELGKHTNKEDLYVAINGDGTTVDFLIADKWSSDLFSLQCHIISRGSSWRRQVAP